MSKLFNLNEHVRVQSEENPLCCSLCDKKLSKLFNLNEHVREHSNENPFSCSLCNKKFCERFNPNPHVRVRKPTQSPVAFIATAASFFLMKLKKIQSQTQKPFRGLVESYSINSNGSKFFPHKQKKSIPNPKVFWRVGCVV